MSLTLPNVPITEEDWQEVYTLASIQPGVPISIQNIGDTDLRFSISATKPARDYDAYKIFKRTQTIDAIDGDLSVWVFSPQSEGLINADLYVHVDANIHDGEGNPIGSLNGALDIHDADVHSVPINELFHAHTGVATTIAVVVVAGDSSITVVDDTGFANGDPIQIEDGVIETTFPVIISGVGTNTLQLDRPLDNSFAIGDAVDQVITNLAVNGSVTPVEFKILADKDQIWHIVRFLLAMVHNTAADDGKFGNIPALTNGCILRGYNATTGLYRTFTNWKSNFDIKMDMFDVTYTDKAGAGDFGTNGRGSIRDGTGAVPKVNGANGDFLSLMIQDDLTTLVKFNLKAQGHIEGL